MRLLIVDHFSNAFESLRANRMRTFLTGLGVTIGVASITAVLSLGAGVSGVIGKQITALEGNIGIIRPSTDNTSDITAQQSFATSTLRESDYETIKKMKGIKQIAPLMIISGNVSKNQNRPPVASVVATTPDLQDIAGLRIKEGQFLDTTTNQDTAVIGQQLSVDLFGTDLSVGHTFVIRGQKFTVIGILKRLNDPINFNTVDFDRTAIIHLEAGKKLAATTTLQQIDFRAESKEALPQLINNVDNKLREMHQGEKDYSIISGDEIAEPTGKLFEMIRGMTVAIASISLVVGGIGIMNIMLVSVAERTREIGLRKAVGASNGHIMWQFIIESLIISLAGGLTGYALGYLAAFGISTSLLTFDPVFTWQIAATSFGISLLVGVMFGLYPAIRAARKDPIESLRHFH